MSQTTKPSSEIWLKNGPRSLLLLKCATICLGLGLPLHLPGVWRQSDTLGVSLRYWLRWTQEPLVGPAWKLLLPAVLQSGDATGIQAMEFPALNLFLAPFWGLSPHWGMISTRVAVLVLTLALHAWAWSAWKNKPWIWWIPVVSAAAGWLGRPIPDLISTLIILAGIPALLGTRTILGATAISLGILMKPTSAVVLLLLFCRKENVLQLRIWGGLFAAMLLPAFYYLKAIPWLQSQQDLPGLFAVQPRPPFSAISEFFTDSRWISEIVQNRWFF